MLPFKGRLELVVNIENVVFLTLPVKIQLTSSRIKLLECGEISDAIEECWKWNNTLSVAV